MCTLLCVCPPRVESLFPPVLWNSCSQFPVAFEVYSLGIPPPVAGPPGWEAWPGAQNLHSMSGLLWYKCSPVCESPTQELWHLILLWLRPSYHLIVASPFSLDVWYLFWWVPVSSCWWLSSSSLWFWCSRKREWDRSRPSTQPSWFLSHESSYFIIFFLVMFLSWFGIILSCFCIIS